MQNNKIVCTAPIDQIAVDILKGFGEIVVAPDSGEKSVMPLLRDAAAYIVRGGGAANAAMIDAGKNLKVIGRPGIAYESVDIQAATARRIPVVLVPAAGSRAVAEAAASYILALCKRIPYWDAQLKSGNWQSRYETKPGDLEGSTLGIVGLGNAGKILAQLMRPFNMTILACDPYVPPEKAEELNVQMVGLNELLPRADFISLHAPLTPETRGLINSRTLKRAKPGACLINTARGGLIESLDLLLEALESGALAGVALDVFDPEPPNTTHPFFKHPNCLVSPHSLALTGGAMAKVFKSMAEDIAAVLSGKRPRFVVNPEVFDGA